MSIAEKAKQDLPAAQFSCDFAQLDFADVRGVLGVLFLKGNQFSERYYRGHDTPVTRGYALGLTRRFPFLVIGMSASAGGYSLTSDELGGIDAVIHWHTHPGNSRGLSGMDILGRQGVAWFLYLMGKQFYSVLYVPLNKTFFWYEYKPVPK